MSESKHPRKRKRWTANAKMEIVLEGLKGDETAAEISRKHGISQSTYYEWREQFLNHGLEGLKYGGKSKKQKDLEKELNQAKQSIGKLTLENEILKKNEEMQQRKKR